MKYCTEITDNSLSFPWSLHSSEITVVQLSIYPHTFVGKIL